MAVSCACSIAFSRSSPEDYQIFSRKQWRMVTSCPRSLCFSGAVGFTPLQRDTFQDAPLRWLQNISMSAFEWVQGHDTLSDLLHHLAGIAASYLLHAFKAFVKWNRQKLPIIAAWLLRTDVGKVLELTRANRKTVLIASALVFMAPGLLLLPVVILRALGFGFLGIRQGSPAAAYQSRVYRGRTPAYSPFSGMQSAGMKMSPEMELVLNAISLSAGLLFVFAWNLE
ncbi:hypothetical protein B0H11DRAFT_2128192 [Mycena galericulata]|nr:hypothetical protein B0H11DRAFT_2128192 [Mycena galericulata]